MGGEGTFLSFKLYVLYYDRQKILRRINITEEGEFLFFFLFHAELINIYTNCRRHYFF